MARARQLAAMKRGLLALHRWLGLVAVAFWLVQAASGAILAFRWEIEDALLAGTHAPADARALGARIDALAGAGGRVADLWASSSASTRFDIYYADAGGRPRVARVDGAGRVLRDSADEGRFAHGAAFDTLTSLHAELLAGEAGSWVVASSGILLLTNVLAGLRLAWPAAGNWRRALALRPAGPRAARASAWHRTLGLWLGVVILPFVCAGILLCFETGLRRALGADLPPPNSGHIASGPATAAGAALAIADARHPGSALSAIVLPSADAPWYVVRQRRPGDLRRNWGTSSLYVAAAGGRVLADRPAAAGPGGQRAADLIYPVHTGQAAGIAGRALVTLLGVWLAATCILGLRLWLARRTKP